MEQFGAFSRRLSLIDDLMTRQWMRSMGVNGDRVGARKREKVMQHIHMHNGKRPNHTPPSNIFVRVSSQVARGGWIIEAMETVARENTCPQFSHPAIFC